MHPVSSVLSPKHFRKLMGSVKESLLSNATLADDEANRLNSIKE